MLYFSKFHYDNWFLNEYADFEAWVASQVAKLHSWSGYSSKNKWNNLWELHGYTESMFDRYDLYSFIFVLVYMVKYISLFFTAFKWGGVWLFKGWNDPTEDKRAETIFEQRISTHSWAMLICTFSISKNWADQGYFSHFACFSFMDPFGLYFWVSTGVYFFLLISSIKL